MTLEEEFEKHWATFHQYMWKSRVLLSLYPSKPVREFFASVEEAVPGCSDCFIHLLEIEDKKVLRIFRQWRSPHNVSELANEVEENHIGGHLVADVAYTFWKYAHTVQNLRRLQRFLQQRVLLEQAIVTSCTAFECFLKEIIPWVLKNHRDSAKRYLGTVGRPIKELGKHDFDPMGQVDKVYLDDYRDRQFPVFPSLADFYSRTFGIDLFKTRRERGYVSKIFEVRHCIVHNAGEPDARWRARTGNARFKVDLRNTRRYVEKIDTKLHDTGVLIYEMMDLDVERAPFRAPDEETSGPSLTEFGTDKDGSAEPVETPL